MTAQEARIITLGALEKRKEANKIIFQELLLKIKVEAEDGEYSLILDADSDIDEDILDLLKDYGYVIKYEDSPYGYSYKTINW